MSGQTIRVLLPRWSAGYLAILDDEEWKLLAPTAHVSLFLALLTLLTCAVGHCAEAEIVVSREARSDTDFMLVPRISRPDPAQDLVVAAQPATAHNDCLGHLTDGQMADDYGPVFGNGLKEGHYKLDLGAVKDIGQVNTYSYRQGNRVHRSRTVGVWP
jgi:hypothetical protein